MLPLFAGLAVCAEEVVTLMLGRQWLPAVPLVQILCGVIMLGNARHAFGTAINAIGKPQINLAVSSIGLALGVLGVLAFGREDMVAAVVAWHCYFVVTWPINFALVHRYIGLSSKEQAAAFAGPMTAAVVMALGLYAVKISLLAELDAVATLLIIVPSGVLIYGGLIMVLRPKLIPDFRQFILSAFRRESTVTAE